MTDILSIVYNLSEIKKKYKTYISIKDIENNNYNDFVNNLKSNIDKNILNDKEIDDDIKKIIDLMYSLNKGGEIKSYNIFEDYILFSYIYYNQNYIKFIKYYNDNKKEIIDIKPGTIIDINKKEGYIEVLCGDFQTLRIFEVQPENKKRQNVKNWLNGHSEIKIGTKLN